MLLERGLYVDHTAIFRSRTGLRTRVREALSTTYQGDE